MSFDWDEYSKLSDEEKRAYVTKFEDAAFEASKGKTFAPGELGLEKRHAMEGSRVIGKMLPDGSIHYYTDEEQRELDAQAEREVEQQKRARAQDGERGDNTDTVG